MDEHAYKVVELIGSSPRSWEEAARNVIEAAARHLHDLRIAEVVDQDVQIRDGKVVAYRTKVKVSFRYHLPEAMPDNVLDEALATA